MMLMIDSEDILTVLKDNLDKVERIQKAGKDMGLQLTPEQVCHINGMRKALTMTIEYIECER